MDSGIFAGLTIPLFYDSLLAKLICWGGDRAEALARLQRALNEYVITGVRTTIPFHQWLVRQPRFLAGNFSTDFIAEEWHPDEVGMAAGGIPAATRTREPHDDPDALAPVEIAALLSTLVAQELDAARALRRARVSRETGAGDSRWRYGARQGW
jgi:acetyl/propionyl-CoA carboxylase alpha subunit